ncbi:MAG TPA: glycosyltransferase family 1 protein, partial [Armatimonadetes bacterium]|nr:glycosyltransferase family 1 protein [Armatimonadota bacterium]
MSKVLMVANWDWVLFNFRISLAKGLRDAGYEVVMVCPPGKWTRELRDAGFGWVCWALDRRSIHPLRELRSLLKLI